MHELIYQNRMINWLIRIGENILGASNKWIFSSLTVNTNCCTSNSFFKEIRIMAITEYFRNYFPELIWICPPSCSWKMEKLFFILRAQLAMGLHYFNVTIYSCDTTTFDVINLLYMFCNWYRVISFSHDSCWLITNWLKI